MDNITTAQVKVLHDCIETMRRCFLNINANRNEQIILLVDWCKQLEARIAAIEKKLEES